MRAFVGHHRQLCSSGELRGTLARRRPDGVSCLGLEADLDFEGLGSLEAVFESRRPRSGHYRDLSEMARALFESLIMNHPFVDGNERVAFFATDTFLRLNGWKLQVEPAEAHAFLSRLLEEGERDSPYLLPWIREALVRLDEPRSPNV